MSKGLMTSSHHSLVLGTIHNQVERNGGQKVQTEPALDVVNGDLSGRQDHLSLLVDVRGAEVQDYVCGRNKETLSEKENFFLFTYVMWKLRIISAVMMMISLTLLSTRRMGVRGRGRKRREIKERDAK